MIVICEECGKKYKIDPAKIKGDEAKVRCKACNHVFIVKRPEMAKTEAPKPVATEQEAAPEQPSVEEPSEKRLKVEEELREETQPISLPKKRKRGLRTKMFILFVILPLVLMAGAGFFYIRQLNKLSEVLTKESLRIVSDMAERVIEEKARSVAAQVQLFLLAHPLLNKEDFNKLESFKAIAVQKVGKRGYTALYELPGPDGIWRTWAHPNEKIIGIDMSRLRKSLGKNFPGFWKVYTGVKGGKESRGYYNWQDKDGKVRAKFMVCVPVRGTRYVVAATSYLDEFTAPVKKLEMKGKLLTNRVKNLSIAILVGTLILIALIVSIYGHILTSRIKSLTELAERISVGELDAELQIKATDEIGDLAEAISRMQESIRLSIERLRKRR